MLLFYFETLSSRSAVDFLEGLFWQLSEGDKENEQSLYGASFLLNETQDHPSKCPATFWSV
jgi:hypothetical protein